MKRKNFYMFGAIAALSMSMAACGGASTPQGGGVNNGAAPGADGCTSVVVATSSEKINLMDDLGKKFKESSQAKSLGKCVSVYPINVASGKGAEILSTSPTAWPLNDKAYWPTVWSPASTVWTDRVAAASGNDSYSKDASFAWTPVVLGMPESMAKALDYPQKPISLQTVEGLIKAKDGWGSVGKPLWGSFKIAKTNPNTSTTGMSTILMQSYAANSKVKDLTVADVAKAAEFSRQFELGAIHYGDTTGNVLTTLYNNSMNGKTGSAYVSAVAIEETSLYNYNLGNPDSHTVQPGETLTPPKEKLIAVYPSGGSMVSDNPAVTLNSQWVTAEQAKASAAFIEFLQTKEAQSVLPTYGFRAVDKSVDVSTGLTPTLGINTALPKVILPKPDVNVVSSAIDQWATIRKPSAVLELIDTSGSMEEGIGGGRTRLDGAIQGAQNTLGNFRATDIVGIWAFTTGLESSIGKNLVAVRDFKPLGGEGETVKSSIADLANAQLGGTPMRDAIATSYDYMVKHAEAGRINAIIVLSDGEDTDSNTSLQSLLTKIRSSAKEGSTQAPVRIFTIAYGDSANKGELQAISQASGGQMFDASNPERIDAVFASVINNF